jgi:hypothetical protein
MMHLPTSNKGDARTIAETRVDAYLDRAEKSEEPARLEGSRGRAERTMAWPGCGVGASNFQLPNLTSPAA